MPPAYSNNCLAIAKAPTNLHCQEEDWALMRANGVTFQALTEPSGNYELDSRSIIDVCYMGLGRVVK